MVKIEMPMVVSIYKMDLTIGKLAFRRVDYKQLSHQKQYVIQIVDCYVAGRFLERVRKRDGARFFIRNIYGEKRGLRTFHEDAFYYELVSKKQVIQQTMEERALLLILRKVIGDSSFTI